MNDDTNEDRTDEDLENLDRTDDLTDTRVVVATQLMRLQGLIGHFERRGPVHRAPWDDPRRGQGRVLSLLKLKPEISQRELTYLLDMSKQSLAELLGKLEKAGLIRREPSADDKRVTVITLTEAGRATDQLGEVTPTHVDEVLEVLSDAELAQLSDYLARLIERFEQLVGGDSFGERRAMMAEFMRRHGDDPRMREGFGPGWGDQDPRTMGGFPGPHGGFGPRGRDGHDPRSREGCDPRGRGRFTGPRGMGPDRDLDDMDPRQRDWRADPGMDGPDPRDHRDHRKGPKSRRGGPRGR
ncbi:MAG: MarR family transcriptional regulator [Propionibacteriaceae bacterium]|nr:MarR family transcriptional regulator [Propionibacteriaceae bacterium]